jgi:DNA-binding response OmpR family regulator
MRPRREADRKMALIVHPELDVLAAMNAELKSHRFTTILARDLPMALFAITQHRFDLGIIAANIGDRGDGWSLAAVLRIIFPHSYIAVTGAEHSLQTYQTAINAGVTSVYPVTKDSGATVKAIISNLPAFTAEIEAHSGQALQ